MGSSLWDVGLHGLCLKFDETPAGRLVRINDLPIAEMKRSGVSLPPAKTEIVKWLASIEGLRVYLLLPGYATQWPSEPSGDAGRLLPGFNQWVPVVELLAQLFKQWEQWASIGMVEPPIDRIRPFQLDWSSRLAIQESVACTRFGADMLPTAAGVFAPVAAGRQEQSTEERNRLIVERRGQLVAQGVKRTEANEKVGREFRLSSKQVANIIKAHSSPESEGATGLKVLPWGRGNAAA